MYKVDNKPANSHFLVLCAQSLVYKKGLCSIPHIAQAMPTIWRLTIRWPLDRAITLMPLMMAMTFECFHPPPETPADL